MIRTVTTISYGHRRTHLEATYNHKQKSWCLQWAHPTQFGYRLDSPIEIGFKTKKLALERKRAIDRGE